MVDGNGVEYDVPEANVSKAESRGLKRV